MPGAAHRPSATAPVISSNHNTPNSSASLPPLPDARLSPSWPGGIRSEGIPRGGATASVVAPATGASFVVASAPASSSDDLQGGTEIFDPHTLAAAAAEPSEASEAPPYQPPSYQPPSHASSLPPMPSSSAPNVSSVSVDTGTGPGASPAAPAPTAAQFHAPPDTHDAAPATAISPTDPTGTAATDAGPSGGPPSTAPGLPTGSSGLRGASLPAESDVDSVALSHPHAPASAGGDDPEKDRSEDVWAARNLTPSLELPPRRVRAPHPRMQRRLFPHTPANTADQVIWAVVRPSVRSYFHRRRRSYSHLKPPSARNSIPQNWRVMALGSLSHQHGFPSTREAIPEAEATNTCPPVSAFPNPDHSPP